MVLSAAWNEMEWSSNTHFGHKIIWNTETSAMEERAEGWKVPMFLIAIESLPVSVFVYVRENIILCLRYLLRVRKCNQKIREQK